MNLLPLQKITDKRQWKDDHSALFKGINYFVWIDEFVNNIFFLEVDHRAQADQRPSGHENGLVCNIMNMNFYLIFLISQRKYWYILSKYNP